MRLWVVLAASYRINENLKPFHDCWIPNHQISISSAALFLRPQIYSANGHS